MCVWSHLILVVFSCIFVCFFYFGPSTGNPTKRKSANENNRYLSRLSSLNFAAT